MNAIAQDIQTHWHVIRPIFVIHTEDDYDMAVERMNNLIDEVGTDEHHPLYDLLDILGTMIHGYEKKHYPIPESNGPEMLGFFMDQHELSVSGLSELGSPNAVSELLNGKRELTLKQIRILAKRFHVSPAVFI